MPNGRTPDQLCLYTPPLSSITSYFEMVDLAAVRKHMQL